MYLQDESTYAIVPATTLRKAADSAYNLIPVQGAPTTDQPVLALTSRRQVSGRVTTSAPGGLISRDLNRIRGGHLDQAIQSVESVSGGKERGEHTSQGAVTGKTSVHSQACPQRCPWIMGGAVV